ncbi:Eco57I restriction-modification methylase domain-containing protein [Halopelagius longus]|uniref:site-specific DNA-methyltransferase (adenine-specific) n=1 Tax=Halopelagius longus TaxID=1236180 RepID=A0A1H0Z8S4_9EURY|nr:N-6 DNA methylase [Halopelagius longus]RDI72885.1 restriction endonuclease [Halopelagius longus]SDQ23774.1 Type I restriction enzyme R protein N terminus (HSDR_N) [Halopelagius longus]
MADTSALLEALHGIGERIDEGMSEKDVENAFLNEDFYEILGYSGAGHDLRSEWTLPDSKRPDYVTLDANESVTAIYEFKTSGKQLGTAQEDQLFHYVDELKADYGVLTNGEELRLYTPENHSQILTVSLTEATDSHAADLEAALKKPEWDITNPSSVNDYLNSLDEVELSGELGREHFFDTFRLEPDSPFANLVTSMVDLLHELRDEEEAKFVKGAYDFWEASYASEPDEVPDSWDEFIDGGKKELRDFMFALESGHALLARLLLAKASLDHEFFPDERGLQRYFTELGGFDGTISLDAYPIAANGMIEDMRNQLVESLFEDDIFIWWSDGYAEETASLHKNPYNRFKDVAKEGTEVSRVSPATRERFSRSVAQVIFSVLKFDFSAVEGDPLGDLYQRYFDPETRKALGEFYTPQEVVDYIMDGVGYDMSIHDERLIDPSCGSGTFLVEAVERYIEDVERYNDDPDWETHLTELCTRPHIVGLDIHPFAVLMAQIRFMVAILPKYREAKQSNGDFTIRRLPIFRTDSLRNERELSGIDLGDDGSAQMTFDAMTEDSQDVRIPVPLPVEVDEDEVDESEYEDGFLVQRVRMPLFKNIRLNTGVQNFGEYFAALQGVLDVAKWYLHEGQWVYNGGLKQGIERYTTREYDGIEEFFVPYLEEILETVRYLRTEHGDGRLFKIFEDTVLSLVVKNYMEYEYVVGNPPYVDIQKIPGTQKDYLKELYSSASGQFDLYCPFYERGIDWLTDDSGRLGFITPNQFMVTDYGRGVRREILENTVIDEVYDFRDSGLFSDATNYPAIVILQSESHEKSRSSNQVRCVRARPAIEDDQGNQMDEEIVKSVREHRGEPGYSDEFIDVFDATQRNLTPDYWALMPPEEQSIFDKLESIGDATMSEVTEAIFPGPTTGANTVYVVDVLNAHQILSEDSGETVTVRPSGGDEEFQIETDLLRPWLSGSDVQRWRCEWSGNHVILPYLSLDEGSRGDQLISKSTLENNYPLTWDYFKAHEDELRSRQGGRWEDSNEWWEFAYPRNLEKFEQPKTIFAHITDEPSFMLDEKGTWYFKTAYAALLTEKYQDITEEIASQLNSNPLEFYFKHISTVKAGGYYEYRAQYVNPIPCIVDNQGSAFPKLRKKAGKVADTIDIRGKTNRFPEAYLGDFDGELGYIDYQWQTRRYPVNADIQELADGRFAVTAGRSDEITAPQMDKGDRDDRKLRAKYVHAAVDGRNMKKGEEQNIPIPKRTEDVKQLIEALEGDEQTVEETSIEALEAEIDEVVYDLFDLTEDERQVIEDYLEVF